jgi:hypothetical protein
MTVGICVVGLAVIRRGRRKCRRIKAQWGIAIQALVQRGRDLGLISTQRHRSLVIQVSSRGWRKNEPEVGVEHPIVLWRTLSSVYGAKPNMAASRHFGIAPELLEVGIPNRASIKQRREGDVVELMPPHTHGRG